MKNVISITKAVVTLHKYLIKENRYISGPIEEDIGGDQNLNKSVLPFSQVGSNNSLKLQSRCVKSFWITLGLMLGKSSVKMKQYGALWKTLIKILFNKDFANQLTTNISFTEKPGNWFTLEKMCKYLWKKDILRKDTGHLIITAFTIPLFQGCVLGVFFHRCLSSFLLVQWN